MHNRAPRLVRSARRAGTVAALVGLAALSVVQPQPADAALSKSAPAIRQRTAATVTADALPTAQIDGVVWGQLVVGNTVFAGGDFDTARPAGAAPGVDTVPRHNLLAFSLSKGELRDFAPELNGEVRTVATTPDHKTLLVGGDFTKVGTVDRAYFAAFNIKTGALLPAAPAFNGRVNAIVVVKKTAYVGGWFTTAGTKARMHLAAVSVTSGKVSTWAPTTDNSVNALVATPDKTKIIVGGAFKQLNVKTSRGMGSVSVKTGKSSTWKINKVVKDYAPDSGILSLAADKNTIYGSGFGYGGGNFEGTFAASPKDGAVKWLQDCHGDTYSVAPIGKVVYAVGHAHHCANIGGFPDTNPRTRWQRALAMTTTAKGTVQTNSEPGAHYGNFGGYPAPALYNWFPKLSAGTFTGQYQGPWTVVGNTHYLALGGEFTEVNGVSQQGLVRFAIASIAPNKMGPTDTSAATSPTLAVNAAGGVTVGWTANTDMDDRKLRYEVLRDGVEVGSLSAVSYFWDRPQLTLTDSDVKAGSTYRYAIRAVDPDDNAVTSPPTTITVPAAGVAAQAKSEQRTANAEKDPTTSGDQPTASPTPTPTADAETPAAPGR